MAQNKINSSAASIVLITVEAVRQMAENLLSDFFEAGQTVLQKKGIAIVSSVGKLGHIGNKIVVTLLSIGKLRTSVDASEARHCDDYRYWFVDFKFWRNI